jgi:hypothetical protein
MKQDKFQSLIRRLLSEELEKTSAVGVKSLTRVPEMDGNGKDVEKKNKRFASDSNTRERQTKEQLLADLIGVVGDIDKSITVVWNDHDDLMVNARDIKFIRISPRWEDYYVIEMMTRNEDRVWVTGLNWEQVKEFVKVNVKGESLAPTYVEKSYDKSYRNREDQAPAPDKGLNQKDKPKTLPLTNEPPKEVKSKDKNYTEKQVKTEADLPNKPMKEVEDYKKQIDIKEKDPVKLRRRKPDTKLVAKQ